MSILHEAYLCAKSIRELPQRPLIRTMVHSLDTVSETDDRSHLGYLARGTHSQFFGYLLVDNQREQMSSTGFPPIPELHDDERNQFLECHQLIVNLCNEIVDVPDSCKKAVTPYTQFTWTPATVSTNTHIGISAQSKLKQSMSNHPSIQAVREMPSEFVQSIDPDQLHMGVLTFLHELQAAGVDSSPNSFEKFRFMDKMSPEYLTARLFFSLVGIRTTLMNLCQLLFQSFLYDKLLVLNEDNIFDLSSTSHFSGKGHVAECQITDGDAVSQVGSLVLLKDIFREESKLQLCAVEGASMSFSRELGSSETLRLRVVDDDLNSFPGLLASLG